MSDNTKRAVYYFMYILLFYFLFYWGTKYGYELYVKAKKSFDVSLTLTMIYRSIFPMILGLLLGFLNFTNKIKKQGQWKVDWLKLIILGIPTLYFGLYPTMFLLSAKINVLIYQYPRSFIPIIQQEIFYSLSGFIFGYIILDSIDKE